MLKLRRHVLQHFVRDAIVPPYSLAVLQGAQARAAGSVSDLGIQGRAGQDLAGQFEPVRCARLLPGEGTGQVARDFRASDIPVVTASRIRAGLVAGALNGVLHGGHSVQDAASVVSGGKDLLRSQAPVLEVEFRKSLLLPADQGRNVGPD